jgi:hypothetical protein
VLTCVNMREWGEVRERGERVNCEKGMCERDNM